MRSLYPIVAVGCDRVLLGRGPDLNVLYLVAGAVNVA
jgi:hypothetical protein